MLAVSSMGHTLSLDIAYYYLEENKHLEQGISIGQEGFRYIPTPCRHRIGRAYLPP
jgi:hypothetical protein